MEFKENFALLNVSVVTGKGDAPHPDMAVVVKDGVIREVRKMKDYKKEQGVQEVSLEGHYVMPGLIDAHVHLSGVRAGMDDGVTGGLAEPKLLRAMRSVYEAQAILKRGFTSVRDISLNGLYIKRLFYGNRIPGPKVVAAGMGLSRTGGHGDLYQYTNEYVDENGFWAILADGKDEVVKGVRWLLREGADQIKFWACGGDHWANDRAIDVHYSMEEMKAIVEEAHRQKGTKVLCHAETRESIAMALEAGVDTIEHGEDLTEELAERMVRENKILCPTLQLIVNWYRDFVKSDDAEEVMHRPHVFLYRELYTHNIDMEKAVVEARQRSIDSFKLALAKGVKVALGSDTVFEPLTPYGEYSALEFKAMIEFGMTVGQAITAATKNGAEALGMEHVLGTVEPGKLADLLVVRKDPTADENVLYDPSNIFLTFCDGRLTVEDGRFAY